VLRGVLFFLRDYFVHTWTHAVSERRRKIACVAFRAFWGEGREHGSHIEFCSSFALVVLRRTNRRAFGGPACAAWMYVGMYAVPH
jgi:hypothetical protein